MHRIAVLFAIFVLSCCLGSCGGAVPSGESSNSTSQSTSTACNLNSCSTSETVCVSAIEDSEPQTCATVAVMETVGDAGGSVDENIALKEYFTTTLSDMLPRADVNTDKDVQDAILFEKWKQALGYTCSLGDECNNLAVEYGLTYARSDILVVPSVYLVEGTYYIFVSAWNTEKNKSIVRLSATAVGSDAAAAMSGLGSQVAEAIKDQKHCLKMTPRAVAVDFSNASLRSKTFTAEVKNLKNEAANVGSVNFSLENPEGGSLSTTGVDVEGGQAEVVFTMTKSRPNTLTASYSSDTERAVEVKSAIIPLCGLIITVNGTRNFTVDHKPFELFEPGSWWTYLGSSTVTGYVPLVLDDEMGPDTVTGTGWYEESQNASVAAHLISKNAEGEIIECDISGTEVGKSSGTWLMWGTKQEKTASIQAMGLGLSGSGSMENGTCPGINVSDAGGFSTLALFGNEEPVFIELENGAVASATGNDGVSDYNYTLKVVRAEK